MLVDLTHVLQTESRARFAYNITSVEGFRELVSWGERHQKPMILQCSERYLNDLGDDFFRALAVPRLISSAYPFVLHLDHGGSLDVVVRALEIGFSSVMFDGSLRPLHENVSLSQQASVLARSGGVSFEAEIGHVGGAEDGDENQEAFLTRVEDAVSFVNQVDLDYLAVSVGNAHGRYQRTPHIQLGRLRELAQTTQKPLVLHGGTGISKQDLTACAELGVKKINIGTELKSAWIRGIAVSLAAGMSEPDEIRQGARTALTETIDALEGTFEQ